ncbi:serine hydrolase domain-containing protein [Novosphingobium sp.]|uniref:serine hydrolase domain-containing protein n=1 Tax=Novosphingobium sp. TaxID=1874826 RepID=UPI003B52C459
MVATVTQAAVSRRGFLGCALVAGGAGLMPRMAFAAPDAATMYPHVAALASSYVDSGKLPGVVAVMNMAGTQSAIMRGVQTLGDPRPADIDSLYRAYSMTKPITGMITMMLIDEGKLKLDQPLSDILPKFAKMQVQVTPDGSITDVRPATTPITIRHLLTHTSGLGYSIIQKGPLKDAYEAAGLVPAEVSHMAIPGLTVAHNLPSLAAFADALSTMPLVYEPGTAWSYSVSLDLLGRVIEVVTGKPFDQVMAERIFVPCGMTNSGFMVKPGQGARLTTNYGIREGKLTPIDPAATSVYLDPPAYPFGGAGLVTSPRDYDRFLQMLLGYGMISGTRVMSDHAVRLGTGDLLPPALVGTSVFGRASGFGAGGRVGIGSDAGTFGWSGAAGTVGFVSYRAGLSASLWVQYMPSNALAIGEEFPIAIVADVRHEKMAA